MNTTQAEEHTGEKSCITIEVEGIVQGVGFRYFVYRNALRLKVTGTVQNLPGSKVRTVAEGNTTSLEALLQAVKQGPAGAWVKHYSVQWLSYTGTYKEFSIIH